MEFDLAESFPNLPLPPPRPGVYTASSATAAAGVTITTHTSTATMTTYVKRRDTATQTEVVPAIAAREATARGSTSGFAGSHVTCPAPVADVQDPAADSESGAANGAGGAVDGAGGGQPSSSSGEAAPTAVDDDHHGPLSKQDRDLKAEAVSTKHLLRHKPFNKWWEACLKSKMAERRHMTGSYDRDPKQWGEIVTADHLVSRKKTGRVCVVSAMRSTSRTFGPR